MPSRSADVPHFSCGNRMCPPGRVFTYSDAQWPANQQTSFSERGDECVAHRLLFSGHIIKKFRGPSILQLNIEDLTASKMNVLYHLATQLGAFVILLQETHCTSAEKLVLSNYQLAGFSLSRKHGLATFVHERLKWTLYNQPPTTSETEWLCVDVDGYKIVNIYKPPPTRLQVSDLPVFTHPCRYAGDFNCPMSTGVITPTARMETGYWPGQAAIILPFSTIPRMNLVFTLGAGTLALTRILPSPPSVLIVACLIDAFWRSFLGHNIDLRL